ncbi:MAG: hypothetical protein AAGF86_14790 [Pseudomonadota bacterium]
MEDISQQLLYQRLRNSVIELLEMHSSYEDLAALGAFESINMVDDWLPLDYSEAPKVFSEIEKEVVSQFIAFAEAAAEATKSDTWDVEYFKSAEEWVRLSEFSKHALAIFEKRGRFSEEVEEHLTA